MVLAIAATTSMVVNMYLSSRRAVRSKFWMESWVTFGSKTFGRKRRKIAESKLCKCCCFFAIRLTVLF